MAWAEWSVSAYKEVKETELMQAYIDGVGRGFVILNVVMGKEIGKNCFCIPPSLALETANVIRILDDEIKRREQSIGFKKAQEDMVEFCLLMGLKTTFPCK
jgi:hypothetical protein